MPKDPNMFDEFRVSYLQDDATSIFMQPYSKYLVGVNALILALIVPGEGPVVWLTSGRAIHVKTTTRIKGDNDPDWAIQ